MARKKQYQDLYVFMNGLFVGKLIHELHQLTKKRYSWSFMVHRRKTTTAPHRGQFLTRDLFQGPIQYYSRGIFIATAIYATFTLMPPL